MRSAQVVLEYLSE